MRTNLSNVDAETFASARRQLLESISANKPAPPLPSMRPGACAYACDTGELMYRNLPCRGNKIICNKFERHTSYTAACTPVRCKFYEAKKEN